jgi:hypothetical protein
VVRLQAYPEGEMNRISSLWCRLFHSTPMHPIHGKYICPDCLREFPVPWDAVEQPKEHAELRAKEA